MAASELMLLGMSVDCDCLINERKIIEKRAK
jgi:hypothetical protein